MDIKEQIEYFGKGSEVDVTSYYEKFSLSEQTYIEYWKPIQEAIFHLEANVEEKFIFQNGFDLKLAYGGAIFRKDQFYSFKECMKAAGDTHFVIILNQLYGYDFFKVVNENGVDVRKQLPLQRLVYPIDVTWEDFTKFDELFWELKTVFRQYFVFGNSGNWGVYIANEIWGINSIDFIGFKPEYKSAFNNVESVNDEAIKFLDTVIHDKKLLNEIKDAIGR